MWAKNKHSGFTIVELLIVIVVIGILAAITIVAYNGVRDKANMAAVNADLSNNNKVVKTISATTGSPATTLDVLQSSTKMSTTQGMYRLSTFCASSQGYALAVETTAGNKYYSLNGATTVQDNNIDVTNACTGLGVASADKIFMGMPATSCATEGLSCTFTGTATIAYGSVAQGKFNARKDLTSPVACNNTFFGDPATGYTKSCYVLSY